MKNVISIPKKVCLNRGRFPKFYEEQENHVRFWGKCDIVAWDYQIFIPSDVFYAYLNCIDTRSYANLREILKDIPRDVQRFLLDGVSPEGWREMADVLESNGINEPLGYFGLRVKSVTLIDTKR